MIERKYLALLQRATAERPAGPPVGDPLAARVPA